MHPHNHFNASPGHAERAHHTPFSRQGGAKFPFGAGFPPHGFGGQRARRGDVRAAILRLLAEQPMHGYQIIQELSERSGGSWSPSAGSVYPTLELLADEGLIVPKETGGKKVFSLTDSGTATAAETADQPAPWDEAAQHGAGSLGYHAAAGKLMQSIVLIGKTGSTEQVKAAIEVMNDTRKKLYGILAQD